MVKKKTSELGSMLMKAEREEAHDEFYFCDEKCYFQFAIKRADSEGVKNDVKNLEELAEWQAKQKAIIKKEAEGEDEKENEAPKHKGVSYKNYSSIVLKSKKHKILNENELTALMFQIGSTMMPPREKEDTRLVIFLFFPDKNERF